MPIADSIPLSLCKCLKGLLSERHGLMKDLKMCVNSFNDANELKDDMKTLKDHGIQGRRLVSSNDFDVMTVKWIRNIYRMVQLITELCRFARLFMNSNPPSLKTQYSSITSATT